MAPYRPRRAWRGATLAELLTCLAVLAILAAAAWPSWQRLLARHQVELATDRLAGSLALARATAVARREDVILSPLPGGAALDRGWRLSLASAQAPAGGHAGHAFAVVEMRDACLRIGLRSTAPGNHTLRMTAVGYSRSEQGGFLAATFAVTCRGEQRLLKLGAHGRVRICTPGQDADCDGPPQAEPP
ncbi:pilus assembly FimT family protein [Cupriavidus sp. 30B13]|uniref:pilus assembly FimT family protein n=1 Tax=Cupriavidus sp. 30B13 TaxID=3384241 RepID=UPI003B8FAF08